MVSIFCKKFFKRGLPRAYRGGFTAVEMLVVIGIFLVMTSVVMTNLPQFREKTLLDLTAQQMATIIRQAQVYGLGTRSFGDKYPSHGVFFNLLDNTSFDPWPKYFVLYADKNGTKAYEDFGSNGSCASGSNNECVERFNLQGGVEIHSLVTCDSSNCFEAATPQLDIAFIRPNPEANFGNFSKVKIFIKSVRSGECRKVIVSKTGQIYTRNDPSCDPNS